MAIKMSEWLDWASYVRDVILEEGVTGTSVARWAGEVPRNGFFLSALNEALEVMVARKAAKEVSATRTIVKGMPEIVNVPLTSEDEDRLYELSQDLARGLALMEGMIDSGYKVTFSKTGDGSSVCCSVVGRYAEDVNGGLMLSGFSDNWYDALVSVAVKHEKSGGDWRSAAKSSSSRPRYA